MSNNLSNKTCKIIVVDPSGPARQMMIEIMRSAFSFENVEGKASVQDTLASLEVEHADWVVTPLMADQPVNALHLLKLCTEHPGLKSVRVSLCLEDEERYVLAAAFELGLLSVLRRPLTRDTLTEDVKEFLARLEANAGNEVLVAAAYLQQHLRSAENFKSILSLQKRLLDIYPGNTSILLPLAEAQFHTGEADVARNTLTQIKMLDAKLSDEADELAKTLFPDQPTLPSPADIAIGGGINVLGVTTVVIVDSDQTVLQGIEDMLRSLGVPSVRRFSEGEEAWEYLQDNPEPDLIITEWRVPKLSGPMLIQRIRHHGFLTVPIVVLSSLLSQEDAPFVREIGVANVVRKPLHNELFIPAIIRTMQQERLPTEHHVLERKMRHLLKDGKQAEAEELRARFVGDPQVPQGRKRLIEAEFAFSAADYALARDAAVDAMKLSGDGILVLNILGKALMRLSDFASALKCFKKAKDLSPQNLERLCLIAEAQTDLGDHQAATAALGEAVALDPNAVQVREAEIKVAITAGDSGAAKKLLNAFESVEEIVAYMNNKAVAFAKCGQTNEAIKLYKRTLESVPEDRPDPKAIVLYNLALAQIRDNEMEAAVAKLNEALKLTSSKVTKKATSLLRRLKHALDTGSAFKLTAGDAIGQKTATIGARSDEETGAKAAAPAGSELSSEQANLKLLATVQAHCGDICCFLVFNSQDAADDRVTGLLANAPRFQHRDAIARDEALGAERILKESA